jgi:hypothetical protein
MVKIFISYKHEAIPDERLAHHFAEHFEREGHNVFIDAHIPPGQEWSHVIQQSIKQADFFIVLLSQYSVDSDMVMHEVAIAHDLKKQHNAPSIIPIRVAYTTPYTEMPYNLGAMLAPIQDIQWKEDGDESAIGQKLNQLMHGEQLEDSENDVTHTTDTHSSIHEPLLATPLPAFDAQWLKELDASGGAVQLESHFYVERQADSQAKQQILLEGVTLRIKGSRQIGKTSLLARLSHYANGHNFPVMYIDFQELDDSHFIDLETLLRYLADRIAEERQTNKSPDDYWRSPLGPKDKITRFLAREVLEQTSNPFIFMMDEVDRLFAYERYRNDFFSLIRSWHNKRSIFPLWKKLNLVLAYSTEAFLFITDLNQSPFNVGTDFILNDLDRSQIELLNIRHGGPVKTSQEMDSLFDLLQGHPFLVRKALYVLAIDKLTVNELLQCAGNEDGPFSDHLRQYLLRLHDNPEQRGAMKSVIQNHTCPTDLLFYQLRSAGLIKGASRTDAWPRCDLYARYFHTHL